MTEKTGVMNKTQDDRPLALLVALFQALNEQGLRYCHWKSNLNLGRSMRGLTDLDLLVDRSHGMSFREVLLQHDFKPLQSPCHKQYPAMEDYLGFDRDSGRLIHLHVHYQLVLGEQYVKNYHLPLEQEFLDGEHSDGGVKLPSPELETIVLAIRALLKTRDRDLLKGILSARGGILPAGILAEFEYLLDQTTVESISSVLESQVDLVSGDLVLGFLDTLKKGQGSGLTFYRLRRRLRRELAPYQRFSRWRAICVYVRNGLLPRFRVLPRRYLTRKRKTMMSGGLTIAVLGVDGAGKSTVIADLRRFLSWRLTLHTYYMGSQQPSRVTSMIGWGSRMAIRACRAVKLLLGNRNPEFLRRLSHLFRSFYLLAVARDRHRRYIHGQRRAAQGDVVLYDRYPLPAIRMGSRFMDGPRIASSYTGEMGRVLTALARAEQEIYRQIRLPDHLIVLHVSPDVSVQRKPDHKREMIETKYQALQHMERADLCATEIDADQPLHQVLLQVKTTVWDLL
jgi:thymidylate kinase